jgi:hypothetical protein
MQTITPHLWFDKEAKQAAQLYTSIFKDSQIKNTVTLHDTLSGTRTSFPLSLWARNSSLSTQGRTLSSLLPYRFSLRVTQKMRLIHFGTVSRETVQLSWNSVQRKIRMDPGPVRPVLASDVYG